MRFKNRRASHQLPEVNLIPMMDVLMTVLTFFIIISMTLTIEQGVNVELPGRPDGNASAQGSDRPAPAVIRVAPTGITLNNQPTTEPELEQQIQTYLAQNPDGVIAIQATPETPYEQVVQLLGDMKDIGGNRVSLVID
ncbi:MAG: biopolymer transporter ExbD [Cyanobacteria bacterium RU_5_0]|nr:biopolymer transporter ExbD [Cyanobacteria bacterium RU_5_0]